MRGNMGGIEKLHYKNALSHAFEVSKNIQTNSILVAFSLFLMGSYLV